MATLQNTSAYVKFVRGTRAAWDVLKTQGQVYDDTLYFIYETAGSSTGVLYLGTKQIGGTDGEQPVPIHLDDLDDVLLSADIEPNSLLIFNGEQWINGTIEDILKFDSNVFELDSSNSLTLSGFATAKVGTIPQKSDEGKISWVEPGNISEITELQNQLKEVYNKEEVNNLITSEIAKVDHLSYKKVGSLDDIDTASSNFIYLVPTEEEENNQYDEYMVIDGNLERVGNWNVDLSGYITTEIFNTAVGELNDSISGLTDRVDAGSNSIDELNQFKTAVGDLSKLVVNNEEYTLIEQVNHLTQQLTWQEIVE